MGAGLEGRRAIERRDAGIVERDRVGELGAVLAGEAEGRASQDAITLFDSTGLAIQDLGIALAVLGR